MVAKKIIKWFVPKRCETPLVRVYRQCSRLVCRRKKIETKYKITTINKKKTHCFFGYYDILPFGKDGRIIYHEVDKGANSCRIVMNNLKLDDYKIISTTYAWNWQQGSRLRWFPQKENVIIFNDFRGGMFISRSINAITGEEDIYQFPLYDISPDGQLGISLDFTRLGYLRPGYGYTNMPFEKDEDIRKKGVDIYNLQTKNLIKTLTYEDLISVLKWEICDYKCLYLNHLSFSPDGQKFLLFLLQNSVNGFKACLLVYDIVKDKIIPLETDLKVSHYDWANNEQIVCTACDNNGKFGYYLYDVATRSRKNVCPDILESDGHPSYIDKGIIVTDTYPDKSGYQYIKMVSLDQGSVEKLASVYDYKVENVERRTDLHPRYYEKKVCFDANISGYRSFNVIYLN